MKNIEERNLIVPELSGSPSGANLLLSNVGLARTVIKEKYDASACAQGIGLTLNYNSLGHVKQSKTPYFSDEQFDDLNSVSFSNFKSSSDLLPTKHYQ